MIKIAKEAQTAATFLSQSRRLPNYKNGQGNRYEARKQVSINSAGAEWVQQDANMLFKTGNYLFSIPVHGKTDDYVVTIQIEDFLPALNKALETKQFSVPTFQQVLMQTVNSNQLQVACTCKDFAMRFSHALTLDNDSAGRPESRPSPVTNPTNQKGCCKHIIYALSRKLWATKVARTLFNYIIDIWRNKRVLFDRIIRPALNNITDEKILNQPEKPVEQPLNQQEQQNPAADQPDTQQEGVTESIETDDLIEKAILHFGITKDAARAGFILPDGRFLDFSGGQGRCRAIDHRQVSVLYNDLNGSDALVAFMRATGCIRVDYASSSISIDVSHEPTDKQYRNLGMFVHNDEAYLDFSDGLSTVQSYEFFDKEASPTHVVQTVRDLFKKKSSSATESINSFYDGKQQYDDDQEFALSICKEIGADVSIYVTPENTPDQIQELGQQLHDGVAPQVIKQLADPLLSYRTIQIIGQASLARIDLLPYKNFAPDALEQILRGVKLGVPVEKIALRGFNSRQIEQLVRAYKISPKLYESICDRTINYNRMRDIIRNWRAGSR